MYVHVCERMEVKYKRMHVFRVDSVGLVMGGDGREKLCTSLYTYIYVNAHVLYKMCMEGVRRTLCMFVLGIRIEGRISGKERDGGRKTERERGGEGK